MSDYPQWLNPRPIEIWPRELTAIRRRAPFSAAWGATTDLLRAELRHLGAQSTPAPVVMQIAITEDDVRRDGRLRTTANPAHPGVILAIESRHGNLSYPCDKFTRWQDNVRAIALALESLRRVDRYGITETGQQYTGWKQLQSGSADRDRPTFFATVDDAVRYLDRWRADGDTLAKALRRAQSFTHPDRTGNRDEWNKVEEAGQLLRENGRLK